MNPFTLVIALDQLLGQRTQIVVVFTNDEVSMKLQWIHNTSNEIGTLGGTPTCITTFSPRPSISWATIKPVIDALQSEGIKIV